VRSVATALGSTWGHTLVAVVAYAASTSVSRPVRRPHGQRTADDPHLKEKPREAIEETRTSSPTG
jgi:hypothetical protein